MSDKADYSREIADLMLESDRILERFYRNSIICTVLVVVVVIGLLIDISILSLDSPFGLFAYYASLFSLLGVLILYLFFYYKYYHDNVFNKKKLEAKRSGLKEYEGIEEIKEKIRERIERMRGEIAWFTQLLSPGAIEKMDTGRADNRGNEEFEYFVRKIFEKMGFRLERSSVVTESGIHMRMIKDSHSYLVFPIHPPQTVDEDLLREANRELLATNTNKALVVTAGSFTAKAKEFVEKRDILLYDKTLLLQSIEGIISALKNRSSEEKRLLTETNTKRLLKEFLEQPEAAQKKP